MPFDAIFMTALAGELRDTLLGWLYLRGETERINDLFCTMMEGETYGN